MKNFGLATSIFALLIASAEAQLVSKPDVDPYGVKFTKAMQVLKCAAYASQGNTSIRQHQEWMLPYGNRLFRELWEASKRGEIKEKELAGFIKDFRKMPSADFVAGLTFGGFLEEAETDIRTKAGEHDDGWLNRRNSLAEIQFNKMFCRGIKED